MITVYNPKTGLARYSCQLVYVSRQVNVLCIDLGMVSANFLTQLFVQ